MIANEATADSSWVGRIIAALFAPLARKRIDPLAEVQRQLVALLLEYDRTLTDLMAEVNQIRGVAEEATRNIESLRGDSSRIMDHLATLQEDHTRLVEITSRTRSNIEVPGAFEKLLDDLHRDMTVLAEAVSRLEET